MRSPPPAALAAALAVVAVAAAAGALSGADLGAGPSLGGDTPRGTPGSGSSSGSAGASGDGAPSLPAVEFTARSLFGALSAPLSPPTIALGVVVIGAIAVVALRGDGDPDGGSTPTSETSQPSDSAAEGRDTTSASTYAGPDDSVAVRAFERLAATVDPSDRETCTPRELQREALDRGFDPAAVGTIVTAFERARYGCHPVDADVEAALSTLGLDGGEPR